MTLNIKLSCQIVFVVVVVVVVTVVVVTSVVVVTVVVVVKAGRAKMKNLFLSFS